MILDAGLLVASVLDIVPGDPIPIAIFDTSASCHMPDAVEMPYRPDVLRAGPIGERGSSRSRRPRMACKPGTLTDLRSSSSLSAARRADAVGSPIRTAPGAGASRAVARALQSIGKTFAPRSGSRLCSRRARVASAGQPFWTSAHRKDLRGDWRSLRVLAVVPPAKELGAFGHGCRHLGLPLKGLDAVTC